MSWFRRLGKDQRGSRPRCVLLVDGSREEVANRLTQLVNLPDVIVSPSDRWMPYGKPVRRNGSWDNTPAREGELDKSNDLVCREIQLQLKTWWLAVPGSNCLDSQEEIAATSGVRSRQVERCLSMELRVTSSFLMQAVRASFLGLPAASSRR